jgi:hypothetical protein
MFQSVAYSPPHRKSQDLRMHYEETNRQGRKGHEEIRVLESSCVSPKVPGECPIKSAPSHYC